jgi:hypothetical protein
VPNEASSDTIELNRILTVGRDATWVEGGQEEGKRSPPAVPRTRPSTPVIEKRAEGAGLLEGKGRPLFLGDKIVVGGGGGGKVDGA